MALFNSSTESFNFVIETMYQAAQVTDSVISDLTSITKTMQDPDVLSGVDGEAINERLANSVKIAEANGVKINSMVKLLEDIAAKNSMSVSKMNTSADEAAEALKKNLSYIEQFTGK